MMKRTFQQSLPICITICAVAGWWASAGDLNPPPGLIQSTMKPLDIVEPRTPIGQADIPLAINLPGSYYLTENLFAATFGENCITISTSNVTLDLNGFMISDSQVGQFDRGVYVAIEVDNIVVRNGVIRGCLFNGLDGAAAHNSQLLDLRALDNGAVGLFIGTGSTVTRCTARSNGTEGIAAFSASVISLCTAKRNGDDGIATGASCTVSECSAELNSGDGIDVFEACTVVDCTAWNNMESGIEAGFNCMVSGCTVVSNDGAGITLEGGVGTVSGCTAILNVGNGIEAIGSDCRIVENNCNTNFEAGILVKLGASCRIEGNHVSSNTRGIDVDFSGNLIIRNTASSNVTDYDIAANNKVGVIVAAPNSGAISGSTGGAGVGTTNPWANLSF